MRKYRYPNRFVDLLKPLKAKLRLARWPLAALGLMATMLQLDQSLFDGMIAAEVKERLFDSPTHFSSLSQEVDSLQAGLASRGSGKQGLSVEIPRIVQDSYVFSMQCTPVSTDSVKIHIEPGVKLFADRLRRERLPITPYDYHHEFRHGQKDVRCWPIIEGENLYFEMTVPVRVQTLTSEIGAFVDDCTVAAAAEIRRLEGEGWIAQKTVR